MDNQTTAPQTPAGAGTVQESKDAAASVASTTAQEAKRVAGDAKHQLRHLMGQTREDLQQQAAGQQSRLASSLRDLAGELRQMADGSQENGMARGLVDDVARRAADAASWLDQREPGALLDEARTFARRRPGAFLAIAAGAGVVAGRLSRGLVDEARDESDSEPDGWVSPPASMPQRGHWDQSSGTGASGTMEQSAAAGQSATAVTPGSVPAASGALRTDGAAMTSGAVASGGPTGRTPGFNDLGADELLGEDDDSSTRAQR